MVKKNLTRKNLSDEIHKILGFSKNFSSSIVDDFFETLISELIKSNNIKISSFGTFKIMNKMERMGRNPRTKIETKITSRKVISFRPSQSIKEKLNK